MTHTPLLSTARTTLFAPASRPDRVLKAQSSGADVVIVDLEDAVAGQDKDQARDNLMALLGGTSRHGRLSAAVAVRINSPRTQAGAQDLKALAAVGTVELLDAVVVPKVEETGHLSSVREALPGTHLVGTIESAAGLLHLEALAAQDGVIRLATGTLDLAQDLGCALDSRTMDAARARLVTVSRALGLAGPLDSPTPQFKDLRPVQVAARLAKEDGFTGKSCIHPAQVDAVAQAFAPTMDEIEWARSVIHADDGATSVDGSMVEAPVLARARAILDGPHA
ncbi:MULTISPECIES: HpcH/HpaI aldolase/citrate lyase family protein [Kocuria]|uniref:CoA ester lyase n=1 Tax=Kocuria subflava TaxID=1736139 RepID=A0A846TSF6_9MICC|nr:MULTISPECIES: CoA ester lyase [Kocuria]NKE09900.1 CoA ester lyase [Kocuria subflava]